MKKTIIAALGLVGVLSTPAYSIELETTSTTVTRKGSPTVALTLGFAFGSGGRMEPGVGVRVLSDNRRNRAVASIGMDYMLTSQSLRGTVGAAYLGRNMLAGADFGYNFSSRNIDFGLSAGATRTKSKTKTTVEQPPT
jgi:hypothetical protein